MMRQAVIIAGGKGTRLRGVSGDTPKPMVVIHNKPLLLHIVEQCKKYKILNLIFLVSYKHHLIKNFFGDGKKYGVNINYIVEKAPLGTAGALLNALPELKNQFLVIYGDTFFDINLDRFWNFHIKNNGGASIFLHPNDHPHDSDLVEISDNNQVVKIHSYPHDYNWRRNLVNAALYIIDKPTIEKKFFLPEKPDIAKHLFPQILNSESTIYGYISSEYIKDMGTPSRLERVSLDINSGKVDSLKFSNKKMVIFLDRDGVINKEVGHLKDVNEFELLPGVALSIARVNRLGILVVVVTNQPVISRGDITEVELRKIHNKMDTLLGAEGAYIDRLYYCPHHPDSGFENEILDLKYKCECRKPNTGMLLKAEYDLNISIKKSWMVGDSTADIKFANNFGLRSVMVNTGHSGGDNKYSVVPDFVVTDLSQAINLILKEDGYDNK